MENRRESVFPFFLVVFLMTFSTFVCAQTGGDAQTEVNKDETVQAPAAGEPVSGSPVPAAETQPVAEATPVAQPMTVSESAAQPAPVAVPEPAVPATPAEQPTVAPEPVVQTAPEARPTTVPEPAVQTVPAAQPAGVTEPAAQAAPAAQSAMEPKFANPATSAAQSPVALPKASGIVEITGYKYPVYLYVPKDYKTDRKYSLIVMAPAESVRTKARIDYLTGLAQRRSIFILSPHVLWPKPGDTPVEMDEWLFRVKKEIVEGYPINKKKIYLIGKNSGAHYAAYLATEHPQEFSAAALFGEAWSGPYEQMIKPSSDPDKQIPFFIALRAGSDAKARNQAWFDRLQKKGYMLYLTEYSKGNTLEDLEFKKSVFEWLEEASQNWNVVVEKSRQGWKGKFKKGTKDFFTV